MKIIKDNGKVVYYYYKKKKGRHKKTGPKKKKEKKDTNHNYNSWDYKIVLCRDNKQIKYLGKYKSLSEVCIVKEYLESLNKKVEFPKQYIKSSTHKFKLNKTEYVILKSNIGINKIQNEFGKYVPIETNSDKWGVYDKFPYLEEETFYVEGYNPVSDRKSVKWIIETLLSDLNKNTLFLKFYILKNKLIIVNDEKEFKVIKCKNKPDCIRLYNYIENESGLGYIMVNDLDYNFKEKKQILALIKTK